MNFLTLALYHAQDLLRPCGADALIRFKKANARSFAMSAITAV